MGVTVAGDRSRNGVQMNGKQGEAELLQGIVDGYKADGERRCYDKAKLFGIDCAREMMENERLKKENAELKAELADWKGNAEGFQPDAYMKLPLDADGVPIRIGDEVNIDGDAMTVLGYRLHNDMLLLVAKDKKSGLFFTPEPSRVRHFKPEPADSWEKLEEDANLGCRDYCEKYRLEECDYNMRLHILARAKKLAKAGEGL